MMDARVKPRAVRFSPGMTSCSSNSEGAAARFGLETLTAR
jgi:hypothetical protein